MLRPYGERQPLVRCIPLPAAADLHGPSEQQADLCVRNTCGATDASTHFFSPHVMYIRLGRRPKGVPMLAALPVKLLVLALCASNSNARHHV